MRVKFKDFNAIVKFTEFTEKLINSNIDVRRGNSYWDGKSFLGLASLDISHHYEISIITSDQSEKKRFDDYMNNLEGGIVA